MRTKLLLLCCVAGLTIGCGSQPRDNALGKPLKNPKPPTTTNPKTQKRELVRVEAVAGVGKRGENLRGEGTNELIAAAPKALFDTEQKLKFMQVKQALDVFEIQKNRYPESHEEFVKEIIEHYNLKLPELHEGERYEWDPKEKKLYAWKFKK